MVSRNLALVQQKSVARPNVTTVSSQQSQTQVSRVCLYPSGGSALYTRSRDPYTVGLSPHAGTGPLVVNR